MSPKILLMAFRAALAIVATPLLLNLLLISGVEAASSQKVIYAFSGGNDGASPVSNLVFDNAGNLYGTASSGGANKLGTVFELSPGSNGTWKQSVIYTFKGTPDGDTPKAGLVLDSSGNLYGTTSQGGTDGHGTVFELSPISGGKWKEKVLHSFTGRSEGGEPMASLILDSTGSLYGTGSVGGAHEYGVVFMLAPDGTGKWKTKVLHSFNNNGHDGYNPLAGLVFDSLGNLYGTTYYGGSHADGAVFELTPGSNGKWTEQVIHSFNPKNGHDGASPLSSLVFDGTGNLYGTTNGGGTSEFYGTVFQLTLGTNGEWKETILHSFTGASDGSEPSAGVVIDTVGNLYGTTTVGGTDGVVYKVALGTNGKWKETVLHNFKGNSDGSRPYSSVILDATGNLFGTTEQGTIRERRHGVSGNTLAYLPVDPLKPRPEYHSGSGSIPKLASYRSRTRAGSFNCVPRFAG